MLNNFFPPKTCRYNTMWRNMAKQDRPQTAMWRMGFVRRVIKSRTHDTNSKYLIHIVLPQQQLSSECSLMLRYTYIACFV